MPELVHELVFDAAARAPRAAALRYAGMQVGYGTLARTVTAAAAGFGALGLGRGQRIAVYLPQREETVAAVFAAAAAGCCAVLVDPACGPARAAALLKLSGAGLVVTSGERLLSLEPWLAPAKALRAAVVCADPCPDIPGLHVTRWAELLRAGGAIGRRRPAPGDEAVLLHDCGAAASAKPVLLHHGPLVAAARAAAAWLELDAQDRLLAALPLQRASTLVQLAGAFAHGACVVLHNPLHARDIALAVAHEGATALAMPAHAWSELARLDLRGCTGLRCAAVTDIALPAQVQSMLRQALPRVRLHGPVLAEAGEVAQ